MKPVMWVGSSKRDLLGFSDDVQRSVGYALYLAQVGDRAEYTKSLKGFVGAGVVEILAHDVAGTFRAVYTVQMAEVIFVLHVFQKKSKHGIATPKREMDLIKKRLKEAHEIYKRFRHETRI